jgi:hypothetical protein
LQIGAGKFGAVMFIKVCNQRAYGPQAIFHHKAAVNTHALLPVNSYVMLYPHLLKRSVRINGSMCGKRRNNSGSWFPGAEDFLGEDRTREEHRERAENAEQFSLRGDAIE